jgi:outer membrane protein assembly factor BamD
MTNRSMISKVRLSGVATLGLLSLLACAVLACGGANPAANVEYAVSAERNYDKGMKALDASEWLAASKYFQYIRSRAQYSRFAVLAEVRLADAQFGAEAYIEAIEGYRVFAQLHPTHELVVNGYTAFRVGEAYAKQLTDESWIFPPSHEKDQGSVEDAHEELARFLKQFPQSPFVPRAKKIIAQVSKRLADHEWYVARYYWDRDHPMGTVLRLRRLIEQHTGLGYDEEARWLLGRAYVAVKMPDRARITWTELVEKFPTHPRAADAKAALATLPVVPAPGAPGAVSPAAVVPGPGSNGTAPVAAPGK